MKYKTFKNMERATLLIAEKGYSWDMANDIAIKCFERSKQNRMSVEWHIEKIIPRDIASQ